jgi:hypothetical protein
MVTKCKDDDVVVTDLAERVLVRVNPYCKRCPGGIFSDEDALRFFKDSRGLDGLPDSGEIDAEVANIERLKRKNSDEFWTDNPTHAAAVNVCSRRVLMEFEDFEAAALRLVFRAESVENNLRFFSDDETYVDAQRATYPPTDPSVVRALRRFSKWSMAELFVGYADLTAGRCLNQTTTEILEGCWRTLEDLLKPPKNGRAMETWLVRVLRTATCPSNWDCVICVGTQIHHVLWAASREAAKQVIVGAER